MIIKLSVARATSDSHGDCLASTISQQGKAEKKGVFVSRRLRAAIYRVLMEPGKAHPALLFA